MISMPSEGKLNHVKWKLKIMKALLYRLLLTVLLCNMYLLREMSRRYFHFSVPYRGSDHRQGSSGLDPYNLTKGAASEDNYKVNWPARNLSFHRSSDNDEKTVAAVYPRRIRKRWKMPETICQLS